MKRVKTLFKSILYVLIFLIVNFGVITIFTLIFKLSNNLEINTPQYVEKLAKFLNDYKILIATSAGVLLFPLIRKNLKRKNVVLNFTWQKTYLYYILIGVSCAIMLNILLFKLGLQSVIHEIKLLPVLSVISTAIIGPIIEEFVFRGIIYNKLKESFTIISSIVLVSLLFGIFHLNLIQGIYAFMLSIVVSICYEKSHNLYVPILIHCFANITTSLLLPFILVLKFIYIDIFFIMFLIIGIFCIFKLKRNMND